MCLASATCFYWAQKASKWSGGHNDQRFTEIAFFLSYDRLRDAVTLKTIKLFSKQCEQKSGFPEFCLSRSLPSAIRPLRKEPRVVAVGETCPSWTCRVRVHVCTYTIVNTRALER